MTDSEQTSIKHIYTDGAAPNNQTGCKLGGAGVAILSSKGEVLDTYSARVHPKQGEAYTTNNRCEMLALCVGLNAARKDDIIYCDNNMVVQGYNQWLVGWKRNGWRTGKKKPVANQDIWQIIDGLMQQKFGVTVEWVKGHNGDTGNELADYLANKAIYKT